MPITNTKEYRKYFTEKFIRSTFCDHIGMYDAEGLTLHLLSGEELEGLITLSVIDQIQDRLSESATGRQVWFVIQQTDHHEPLGF